MITGVQLGLVGLAALLGVWLIRRLARSGTRRPFAVQASLLTPAERHFLGLLEQAVDGDYRVYPRIQLTDIVHVRDTAARRARQRAASELAGRRADFVLCTPQNLMVVAIIAYGHDGDQALRRICRDCGLALVPFSERSTLSVEAVRRKLLTALGSPNAPELGNPEATVPTDAGHEPTLPSLDAADTDARDCPVCGTDMTPRDDGWHCPACALQQDG